MLLQCHKIPRALQTIVTHTGFHFSTVIVVTTFLIILFDMGIRLLYTHNEYGFKILFKKIILLCKTESTQVVF